MDYRAENEVDTDLTENLGTSVRRFTIERVALSSNFPLFPAEYSIRIRELYYLRSDDKDDSKEGLPC